MTHLPAGTKQKITHAFATVKFRADFDALPEEKKPILNNSRHILESVKETLDLNSPLSRLSLGVAHLIAASYEDSKQILSDENLLTSETLAHYNLAVLELRQNNIGSVHI